jgi:small-conductance mechanosensitive channel
MCNRSFFNVAVKQLFFIVLIFVALAISGSLRVSIAGTQPLAVIAATTDPAPTTEASGEPDRQNIDSLVAVMDDEQVRRLLIDELKTQAAREQLALKGNDDIGGIAGFIKGIKNRISIISERIEDIKTSDGVDVREEFPVMYKIMGKGEASGKPVRAILGVILVFAGAMLLDWIFRRYLLFSRKRIAGSEPPSWSGRLAQLAIRAVLDCFSIGFFTVAVFIISYAFLANTPGQRVLVAAYLAAIVLVRLFAALFRVLFSVDAPALRMLPLSDAAARYLNRWLLAVLTIEAFGLITCGIFRLAGMRELNYLLMITLMGCVVAGMFVFTILQKRKPVAAALSGAYPATSLVSRLAERWHQMAISGVVLLLIFSILSRVISGRGGALGFKTLLIIGLYFLLDWLLRKALKSVFGLAPETTGEKPSMSVTTSDDTAAGSDIEEKETAGEAGPDGAKEPMETVPADGMKPVVTSGDMATASDTAEDETAEKAGPDEAKEPPKTVYVGRMKTVIKIGLRIGLVVYALFWILKAWGIQLPIGQAISKALFSILITVAICYVVYELINAKIQQKINEEMPDDGEELEEGGAGGSRLATLLLLLQRFFFSVIVIMAALVALASLGVDIGPLIAGAGIVGLAIGLGAQTLVTDIISGLFFLIDDAFRVGDYIDIGGTKGMVQEISIRSMKLRHPRGMVNTVPFGNIGTVTNFSRDYIITKLDFRMRYDTDVEKVRKIIKKKVYQTIQANEELGPKLLAPIKSQGVRMMEDSAMVMRVKYKTLPGEQFSIRKEVYRLMREAFEEEGIEFAHRNVTVYIPPETQHDDASTSENHADKLQQAAAAAAIITEQEQTEEMDKKK